MIKMQLMTTFQSAYNYHDFFDKVKELLAPIDRRMSKCAAIQIIFEYLDPL